MTCTRHTSGRWAMYVTVSELVKEVEAYKLCGGVNASETTGKLYHYCHFFESRLGGG